jgi:hypothetical protein
MRFTNGLAVAAAILVGTATPALALPRMTTPPAGKIYHGVYPGGVTGEEDDLTPADVDAYEAEAGKPVAWIYFSQNWYRDRLFPAATTGWIRDRGAVPYVRLMIRSIPFRSRNRPPFRLRDILDGAIDADLRQWFRDARDFGTALLVEYGTECNGNWFPWNAQRNGRRRTTGFGDPGAYDGVERFVATYRHLVTLSREEGADNITWVFHVNWDDGPPQPWNLLESYYPGDDVVDWVAISAYGPQTPIDNYLDLFRDAVDSSYARLQQVAPAKPVIIAEFGATAGNRLIDPEDWAGPALDDLLGARWPNVVGFSWWNERWQNDNNPAHDTTMRLQDIPALSATFSGKLDAASSVLQTSPVIVP